MSVINSIEIIEKYYTPGTPLFTVLVEHSRQVADLAVTIAHNLAARGEAVDVAFVGRAAMLHDIGIVRVDAPSIHCTGSEPYICHGVLGRQMLDELGLHDYALVCERHTGAGITIDDIDNQQLPLPRRDMVPVSVEEQIVCYADKFYSKTHVGAPPRDVATARGKLERFGQATLARFDAMHARFGAAAASIIASYSI